MVLISYSGREINAKLVYYGPGLSGKTTNLESIYAAVPQTHRGKMVSMKTKTERTLFFDFLPIDLGELSGFKTRFLLYTVPGQVYYNATRKLVLKGVDAIVFVADSKRGKMDENVESLENLRSNLKEHGLELDRLPWVIQYNKRDLSDIYSVDELERALNPGHVPSFEAIAKSGEGVFETFKAISRMLLKHLSQEIGVRVVGTGSESAQAGHAEPAPASVPQSAAPAPVAPPMNGDSLTPPGSLAPPPPAPAEQAPRLFVKPNLPATTPPSEPAEVPPVSSGDSDEPVHPHGKSGRLRRWLGRTGEGDEGEVTVEVRGDTEPSRRPLAPPPVRSPEPLIPPDAPHATVPATEPGTPVEPAIPPGPARESFVEPQDVPPPLQVLRPGSPGGTAGRCLPAKGSPAEVPVVIDLDPEDLERGLTLRIQLRMRRPDCQDAEDADGMGRARAA